jgi:hypothetical protein
MNNGIETIEYAENYFNGNLHIGANGLVQFLYGNMPNFKLKSSTFNSHYKKSSLVN